jgi:hypothetical protein
MTIVDSLQFFGAVLGIAFVAWLVRSIVESEPDPLLLNLTFFAFAGQCALTAELIDQAKSMNDIKRVLFLDVFAFLLVWVQVTVVKAHEWVTRERYKSILTDNGVDANKIEPWSVALFRITGADLFPQFYQKYVAIRFLRNLPAQRRDQAVLILRELFKDKNHNIDAEALKVNADDRKWLWRLYEVVCLLTWVLFFYCLYYSRKDTS